MSRLKISAGVLALLLVMSVTGLWILYRQCGDFVQQTEHVITAVETENKDAALDACEELLALWEQFHDVAGVFVDGQRLDPIREILSGLPALIEAEHPEVLSHLYTLRTLAEDIYREELPDLWHIL